LIFVTREGRRQSAAPNQANDHGEIIVSGNSDVDIDAERLNSYRGRFRAYQRRTGAPHAFLAPMTMAEDFAAKAGAAPRGVAFIDSTFVVMCTIGRFPGAFRGCFCLLKRSS
jgi:hypothetical protein